MQAPRGIAPPRPRTLRSLPASMYKRMRGTLPAPTVGFTPDPIVVAVKVRPVSRVPAAHRCRAGYASFRTVCKCSSPTGGNRSEIVSGRLGVAKRGRGTPMAVIVARRAIGVAAIFIQPAAMRARLGRQCQRKQPERNPCDELTGPDIHAVPPVRQSYLAARLSPR